MSPAKKHKRPTPTRRRIQHAPQRANVDVADRLLKIEDVAGLLQVSAMTVRRLVKQEDIDYVRVGGQIRFTRAQIENYIEKCEYTIDPTMVQHHTHLYLAGQAVALAIHEGRLLHPTKLPCTDCGAAWRRNGPRHEYDHHVSYAPEHYLSVEPVCKPCHTQRHVHRRQTNTVVQ